MEHLFEVIEKLEPVFTQILKPVLHPNRIRAIEQI